MPPCDASDLDTAASLLRGAYDELTATLGPARALTQQMDWQADAARAFHASMDDLVAEVRMLARQADAAVDAVASERARAVAAAEAWCP